MKTDAVLALAVVSLFFLASSALAEPSAVWPAVKLVKIAEGFRQPTHITYAGDGSGRIFVVEREGRIRTIKNGRPDPKPFLDIRKKIKSTWAEQGLLSVAFPPDFKKSGTFYINYTGRKGVGDTFVSRLRLRADGSGSPASEEVLLTIRQPYTNHNGGQIAFGPDGYLYIGMGDGGSGGDPHGNGQNLKSLLGKLLRIDVSKKVGYSIPHGNPFRDEIWAYGLRNPWRFSFDRKTHHLYIADVGQHKLEEIDLQPATSKGGENYGWNIMEGTRCYREKPCSANGLVLPVFEVDHQDGDCSITGGYVQRGGQSAMLDGIYFFDDFCSGSIRGLRQENGKWESAILLKTALQISTFGEDERGNVYVADYGNGTIYRLEAK